mmetsp:Transcript_29746/g.65835  ORF Transcript_29746/g.65835 Transcript_29746/m.65835 type:complete len:80 (-) Transcript_29746:556-795(-)
MGVPAGPIKVKHGGKILTGLSVVKTVIKSVGFVIGVFTFICRSVCPTGLAWLMYLAAVVVTLQGVLAMVKKVLKHYKIS